MNETSLGTGESSLQSTSLLSHRHSLSKPRNQASQKGGDASTQEITTLTRINPILNQICMLANERNEDIV